MKTMKTDAAAVLDRVALMNEDKELFGVVRSVAEEIDRSFGHDTSEGIRCFSREDQSVFDVKNYLV